MFVSEQVCVGVCMSAPVCYAWRGQANLRYHVLVALILGSVTGLELARKAWILPRFLCGLWKSDLGLHAFEAGTLPTELSLQAL